MVSDAAKNMAPLRIRLRTLVNLRWLAVAGQVAAVIFVYFGLGFTLPLYPVLAAIAASGWLNVVLTFRYPASKRLTGREARIYLGYDLLQLAVLLFLTGGLQNPFALLFLAPVTISATILSLGATVQLGGLAFICVTLLAFWHEPLPWRVGETLNMPALYTGGIWAAISLGLVFLSAYAWRVAAETRRMSDALAATQMSLARQQQLSALGALAAAAAHELGSPLGTISVVARELEHSAAASGPMREDLTLLREQAERCREILARLSHRPGSAEHPDMLAVAPITEILSEVYPAADATAQGVRITVRATGPNKSEEEPPPLVRRSPELAHALSNLVENAVEFAENEVILHAVWSAAELRVRILDDGPGFASSIMGLVGEPYLTTRRSRFAADGQAVSLDRGQKGGMGLGIFIAKDLLERTGAQVSFANRKSGGAAVTIAWPRPMIEVLSIDETNISDLVGAGN